LADVSELPNLKELEELSRAAFGEGEMPDEPGESDNTPSDDANASEATAVPPEIEPPEVEEMVTAVDRAVHGGTASEPETIESGSDSQESHAHDESNS
jgi:hypothetical protein